MVTYGESQRKAEALIGDAVASVVRYAREVSKPVVIEKLDFRQKKAILEGQSRKYSRMLSSFSYGKIKAYFISRGYREGVEVHQVNPAFSSVIGRVKFMERYGLSVHQAAALVLARRSLGFSERIPRRWACPVGNGVHVAFALPARNAQARVDNSVDRTFRSFLTPDLLILDDLGLHRLTAQQSADLYELILNRHRASSFVITSNRAVDE